MLSDSMVVGFDSVAVVPLPLFGFALGELCFQCFLSCSRDVGLQTSGLFAQITVAAEVFGSFKSSLVRSPSHRHASFFGSTINMVSRMGVGNYCSEVGLEKGHFSCAQ